jgi:hypothetical protein
MGLRFAVRGPLAVRVGGRTTLMDCRSPDPLDDVCCNGVSTSVLVGGDGGAAVLDGMGCGGDASEMCCGAPAHGQTVVATGRLLPNVGVSEPRWKLADVALCVEDADARTLRP